MKNSSGVYLMDNDGFLAFIDALQEYYNNDDDDGGDVDGVE